MSLIIFSLYCPYIGSDGCQSIYNPRRHQGLPRLPVLGHSVVGGGAQRSVEGRGRPAELRQDLCANESS